MKKLEFDPFVLTEETLISVPGFFSQKSQINMNKYKSMFDLFWRQHIAVDRKLVVLRIARTFIYWFYTIDK